MGYFNKNGITATHAAFIKNVCKELVQSDKEKLSTINIVDSAVSLIGSSNATIVSVGVKNLNFVVPAVNDVIQAFALSAWLGEAIKAKQEILSKYDSMDIFHYCQIKDLEVPVQPVRKQLITEDMVIAQMSASERFKYLMLETRAAHIGEVIHPGKALSSARKKADQVLENPTVTSGSGRDMTITKRSLSVDPTVIDELFFNLQNEHRKAQAELNQMKSDIKKKVDELNLEIIRKYDVDYTEWSNMMKKLNIDKDAYLIEQRKEASALKIAIPNELRDFYNLINSMGK